MVGALDIEPLAHDQVIVMGGKTWDDYQRMLKVRGYRPTPRISFIDGVLEIMSPSMSHESIGGLSGRLVEVWCLHHDVEFRTLGSWTIGEKTASAAVEPDECYVMTMPARVRANLARSSALALGPSF